MIAIYASDDRYTDDVHYTGGAVKLLDLVDHPLYMVALNALPPVPQVAGPDWRERWRQRVEGLGAVAAAVAGGAGRAGAGRDLVGVPGPAPASFRTEWPEATVATSARLDVRGDPEAFEVRLDLEAREGEELRWARSWRRRIPRRLG